MKVRIIGDPVEVSALVEHLRERLVVTVSRPYPCRQRPDLVRVYIDAHSIDERTGR